MPVPRVPEPARAGQNTALPAARQRRPYRTRRLVLLALLGIIVAAGAWTLVAGLVAAHRLETVRADLSRVTQRGGLDRETLQSDLRNDLATVRSADRLMSQPGPRLIGWIPIVGRSVDAERTVTGASAAAIRAGLTLTTATDDLGSSTGGVNIQRLRSAAAAVAAAARSLRAPLHQLATQSTAWTPGPVRTGVRQARDQLLGLDDRLSRGAAGLEGVTGALGGAGSRRVLVGLMNNAELRGSGGLLSAYATGTTNQGELSLGKFRDVNLVAQPPKHAVRVPAPAAYHAAYGSYLADSTLWKNVTMSAQGADSAQVLAEVAAASLHVRPDVVVLIDVPAAADIISATGPVTIQGRSVTGAQLTRRLLVDAYGNGSLSAARQDERRKALTSAASQAFDRLRHDAASTPALLQALLDAVSGRHIVIWSARPAEEADLTRAGAAGVVNAAGKDIALAVTNNLGDSQSQGNKLDYYIQRRLTVDVRLRPNVATVTQTLVLHNAAPTGLGPYIEGVAHPGEIDELLSMDAAATAKLTSFTHDGASEDVQVARADGGQRLTTLVRLGRGATTTYRLSYQLPLTDGRYRLLLVPQALAHPAQLQLTVTPIDAELGVATGIHQPRDGRLTLAGQWDTTRDITVPVHGYQGLRGVIHHIAHFWTHKVTL